MDPVAFFGKDPTDPDHMTHNNIKRIILFDLYCSFATDLQDICDGQDQQGPKDFWGIASHKQRCQGKQW